MKKQLIEGGRIEDECIKFSFVVMSYHNLTNIELDREFHKWRSSQPSGWVPEKNRTVTVTFLGPPCE